MKILPFSAFVGLDELKKALLVLAVDNNIGGLLISGPKGTGKSSIVRAFADLLPEIEVVADCPFNCDPRDPKNICDFCKERYKNDGKLPVRIKKMEVVTLPIGATEDMVLGTINIERTLKEKRLVYETGLLGKANRNILYIDEVNLLPDHIVDAILDAAALGWNIVEREGISLKHPSRFILIGTMNPEEGELRPQLLDRFAIGVKVHTIRDPKVRAEIVRRNLEFEKDPEGFKDAWNDEERRMKEKVIRARALIDKVKINDELVERVTNTCVSLDVDGYRPDIVAVKVARALAALDGRTEVTEEDILTGLKMALIHRTRAEGLKPPPSEQEILSAYYGSLKMKTKAQARIRYDKASRETKKRFFPGWTF